MFEVWLRPNARILWLSLLLPLVLVAISAPLAVRATDWPVAWLWRGLGGVGLVVGAAATIAILRELRTPRLAYAAGRLLVHLGPGAPIGVPIEFVEAFLLGQGPGHLPGKAHARREAATLAIRLAERAADWTKLDVSPRLGKWCGGYVTILGTCCEPLSLALVQRLNARLDAVQRSWADETEAADGERPPRGDVVRPGSGISE